MRPPSLLLHHVGYVRQQCNLTCTLHGLSHAALKLQRGAGDATGQDLALLVEELLQELGVLVVDVLDAELLAAALLILLRADGRSVDITDF